MTTKDTKQTAAAPEKKAPVFKYVTLVFKYFDKNKKNSFELTDFITDLLESVRAYNNRTNWDDVKFDLYGLCVEDDSDIAESKNEFVKLIGES